MAFQILEIVPLSARRTDGAHPGAREDQGIGEDEDDAFKWIITLEAEDFDDFIRCMTNPKQPSEALLRGAELLRRLRRKSP